jgi:hypothetical protein
MCTVPVFQSRYRIGTVPNELSNSEGYPWMQTVRKPLAFFKLGIDYQNIVRIYKEV